MSGDKRKISSGSEISFSELKQLAEDGDAIAQNKLAIRYKNGKGVRKNLKLAAEWFAKSAEQGNLAAQFNIGAFNRYKHFFISTSDYTVFFLTL